MYALQKSFPPSFIYLSLSPTVLGSIPLLFLTISVSIDSSEGGDEAGAMPPNPPPPCLCPYPPAPAPLPSPAPPTAGMPAAAAMVLVRGTIEGMRDTMNLPTNAKTN